MTQLTKWHLMTNAINIHKDSFMSMTGVMSQLWQCHVSLIHTPLNKVLPKEELYDSCYVILQKCVLAYIGQHSSQFFDFRFFVRFFLLVYCYFLGRYSDSEIHFLLWSCNFTESPLELSVKYAFFSNPVLMWPSRSTCMLWVCMKPYTIP